MEKNLKRTIAGLGAAALIGGSLLFGAGAASAAPCPAGYHWNDLGAGGGYCSPDASGGGNGGNGSVDLGGGGVGSGSAPTGGTAPSMPGAPVLGAPPVYQAPAPVYKAPAPAYRAPAPAYQAPAPAYQAPAGGGYVPSYGNPGAGVRPSTVTPDLGAAPQQNPQWADAAVPAEAGAAAKAAPTANVPAKAAAAKKAAAAEAAAAKAEAAKKAAAQEAEVKEAARTAAIKKSVEDAVAEAWERR